MHCRRLTIYSMPSYQLCFSARFVSKLVPDLISAPASAVASAAHTVMRRPATLIILIVMALATPAGGAGTDDMFASARPPAFDGSRSAYTAWTIAFSGWLAWRLTDASAIFAGDDHEPVDPGTPARYHGTPVGAQ